MVVMRSQSDSFLCAQSKLQFSGRRKILSRIISILHLDRCVNYHTSSSLLTCSRCISPDLRARRMDSTDGREIDKPPKSPRSAGLHLHRHLEPPKTILDVDYKLLQSGVAILPGKYIIILYYLFHEWFLILEHLKCS
jgi:hypothetical protein